jgi:hypothetical protein
MRIRWGWVIGCIVLGLAWLAGIAAGFLVVGPADHGVRRERARGVGTTLLLVRDRCAARAETHRHAARAVRRAVDAKREASDARIERLVGDLDDRLSTEWIRTDPADVDAMKRRTAEHTDGHPGRHDAIEVACPVPQTCRCVASRNTYGTWLCNSRHKTHAVTDSPRPAQIRDTSDFEMPASTPSAATRSSIAPTPAGHTGLPKPHHSRDSYWLERLRSFVAGVALPGPSLRWSR